MTVSEQERDTCDPNISQTQKLYVIIIEIVYQKPSF